MQALKSISFLLLISLIFSACGGPVEEAKEANEEKFEDTVLEDDANFAVEFANYLMFTDTLSEIVLNNTSDQLLKDYASKLQSDHQDLHTQLKTIADKAKIVLPEYISPDYQDIVEDIAEEDEADMREDYLEKMMEMHEKFGKKADDKIADTEFSQFLDFARHVSSQQYVHLEQAKALLGTEES